MSVRRIADQHSRPIGEHLLLKRARLNADQVAESCCLHVGASLIGDLRILLDGSGGSLHRRGYRAAMGAAPLKENLAAGLIRLTSWDGSVPLVDPCCGSGILLIEAVAMALQQAPGLSRSRPPCSRSSSAPIRCP